MQFIEENNRYEISGILRDTLSLEEKDYMQSLDRFFCKEDALCLAVEGLKGASKGNLLTVLKTISNATLGWNKPFERLNRSEFVAPRESSGTTLPSLSKRTVSRCTEVLEKAGLIYKIKDEKENTLVHYGICISSVMTRISSYYSNLVSTSSKSAVKLSLWNKLSSSELLTKIQSVMSFFATKIKYGIEEIRKFLTRKDEDAMANAEESIKKAQEASKERMTAKNDKKADQSFFDERTGRPNAKAALAFWEREVKDTEHWPSMSMPKTGRTIGMMKNWLMECKDEGEEQIRKNIHDIVSKWFYVADSDRSLTAISKKGKPYEVRMGYFPSFETFYANRNAIIGVICKTALPGKSSDGAELRDVESWM